MKEILTQATNKGQVHEIVVQVQLASEEIVFSLRLSS